MIERIGDMPAGTIGLDARLPLAQPGEVRVFDLGEGDEAREWVSGG